MTRRLHPCRNCKPEHGGRFQRRGFTRHRDRICAECRRERKRGTLYLLDVGNPFAATMAELERAIRVPVRLEPGWPWGRRA